MHLKRYLIGVVIMAAAVFALAPQPEVTANKSAAAGDGWFVPR
jgi:hypothetical protein